MRVSITFFTKVIRFGRHITVTGSLKIYNSIFIIRFLYIILRFCVAFIRSYHDGWFIGRGNQYIQLVSWLCIAKRPTISKKLPTYPTYPYMYYFGRTFQRSQNQMFDREYCYKLDVI